MAGKWWWEKPKTLDEYFRGPITFNQKTLDKWDSEARQKRAELAQDVLMYEEDLFRLRQKQERDIFSEHYIPGPGELPLEDDD